MRGHEQEPARAEDARELVDPGVLDGHRQVREHGERVDEVHVLRGEGQRRLELVLREGREGQVAPGTSRRQSVEVRAAHLSR